MPRSFLAAVPLGCLLVLSSSARAEGPVEITVLSKKAGGRVGVRVAATGDPVFLPACRGVVWEAFDAEAKTFHALTTAPCGPTANAVKIDKDGTELRLDSDPKGAQAVRPVLLVAEGCAPDKPFPLAGCARTETVKGPPVMVAQPAG